MCVFARQIIGIIHLSHNCGRIWAPGPWARVDHDEIEDDDDDRANQTRVKGS